LGAIRSEPEARTVSRLDGRLCVVTGGAAGIADINGEAADRQARRLQDQVGVALSGRVYVSVIAEVTAFIDATVSRFAHLDAIVNNAGVAVPRGVEEISEEDWGHVVAVNLKGVWAGMKYAIPHLRQPAAAPS